MIISGIYKITNTINGKCYVGSAVNIERRWDQHRRGLNKEKHYNPYLQASWTKYRESAFKFEIIEVVTDKNHLCSFEQVYLDLFRSYDLAHGYNICITAGSRLGMKLSDEAKLKMSLAKIGTNRSDETKAKISMSTLGRVKSAETRAKLSAAGMGKLKSDETKSKIRATNTGRLASAETKAKHSKSRRHTGKGYCFINASQRWEGRIFISVGRRMRKSFPTEVEAAAWVAEIRGGLDSITKEGLDGSSSNYIREEF